MVLALLRVHESSVYNVKIRFYTMEQRKELKDRRDKNRNKAEATGDGIKLFYE